MSGEEKAAKLAYMNLKDSLEEITLVSDVSLGETDLDRANALLKVLNLALHTVLDDHNNNSNEIYGDIK
ncbi:MAG: hypothetical protein WAV43_07390 [Streptococcus parauberis]